MTVFEPGTEVTADEALGGYSGVVVRPHGTFDGIEGTNWRTCTQIRVTDPAAGYWAAGQLVNVETEFLREGGPGG
ncbi:MAG TPA: hypothetical protein VMK84_02815 [Streptosporangiaceae bacterium]|nr:hypothetical protein [Streptosporangiaceae bacterium]